MILWNWCSMWHFGITQRRCEDNSNSLSHHSTWPSQAIWWTHAPTFNKWHKQKKKTKKKTLHMLTHGTIWGCGLTSLVVCINDKFCDIRERNVTRRSEIWTTNIRSLGFRDIRECVTLWRLILHNLGCTYQCVEKSILLTQDMMMDFGWQDLCNILPFMPFGDQGELEGPLFGCWCSGYILYSTTSTYIHAYVLHSTLSWSIMLIITLAHIFLTMRVVHCKHLLWMCFTP